MYWYFISFVDCVVGEVWVVLKYMIEYCDLIELGEIVEICIWFGFYKGLCFECNVDICKFGVKCFFVCVIIEWCCLFFVICCLLWIDDEMFDVFGVKGLF